MGRKPRMTLDIARAILVIRIDRIGDLVLTTPSILALRKSCPHAHITAVLSPVNAELLNGAGLVDEILVWDEDASKGDKQKFFKNLTKRKFDAALVFSPTARSYQIAARSRALLRAGIVYGNRPLTNFSTKFTLNHKFVVDQEKRLAHEQPALHEVEKGAGLLATLGVPEIEGNLHLPLPGEVKKQAAELLDRWSLEGQKGIIGLPLSRRYINAGLTASELKILAEEIRDNFPDYLLLITYGSEEDEMSMHLKELLKDQYGIVIIGELSLQLWAALIQSVSLLVSIDSGAVHIAASGGASCVVLYPEEIYQLCSLEWEPWNVKHRQLVIRDIYRTADAVIVSIAVLLGEKKEE
ncbi:MAG: hypothetical protein M1269_13420 [Chloroflexi bacterium]|nr:hypothetical protein [Chloroflexota bacterium]